MGTYDNINVTLGEGSYPFNYNPVHAVWQTLKMVGLPETWLDSVSFLAAAEVVYDEGTGISMNMRDHQPCLTYVRSLLSHINGILFYGADGTLHLKLIRDDYTVGNLQVVDIDTLLDDPMIERGSWMETTGEIQIQYSQIGEPEDDETKVWVWTTTTTT